MLALENDHWHLGPRPAEAVSVPTFVDRKAFRCKEFFFLYELKNEVNANR